MSLTKGAEEGGAAPGPAIQRVAVIGAGERGRSFAFRCAQAGFAVALEDVLSSNLRKAEQQFGTQPTDTRDRVHLVGTVEDAVREADFAIDFVPDELESKLEIFSMMDRMAPPKTIFCTPTKLSLTDLASCTYRADRCVGLEWNEAERGGDVHLVRGAATTEITVVQVSAFLAALGCVVQVIAEDPLAALL